MSSRVGGLQKAFEFSDDLITQWLVPIESAYAISYWCYLTTFLRYGNLLAENCIFFILLFHTALPLPIFPFLQRINNQHSLLCRAGESAVLAMIDSVRSTVRPSVTRWYHAKTTPAKIMRSSL